MDQLNKIVKIIKQNQRFLITAHDNLDGDSFGCGLALCFALKNIGKHAKFYLRTPIPARYSFLPGVNKFTAKAADLKKYKILIILDTAGWDQLQGLDPKAFNKYTIINIDHHVDNMRFGTINWVDTKASAVGEQIYNLIRKLQTPITKEIASCLYTSIITDTGCFQFTNTTPTTHIITSNLIKTGIFHTKIYEQIYEKMPLRRLKLFRRALETLKTDFNNQIIWMWVTQKMFKETNTNRADTEGFIDYIKAIDGIKAAIVFKESNKKNEVRVTFRSKTPEIKVNEIAHKFNGGGHPAASGCTTFGSNKEVEKKVLKAVKQVIYHKL